MSEAFSRRVLFAVTGMSPQIVTETAWALIHEKGFTPTEIRLVTTSHGRNRAVRDLLDPVDGKFHQFCRDFDLVGRIQFDENSITVIRNREGAALSDIRTPEDNACAADMIVREIRKICSDRRAALHVSIAGGRKSMGFFAGYAMSLYGRAQDSLSHVLVTEPFESNRDFFYPSPALNELFAQDGTPLDPREARVMLADIPFVRMREGLPEPLLAGSYSFGEAVREAQAGIQPKPNLCFDLINKAVRCRDVTVKLPPLEYAVYYWFARRAKDNQEPIRPGENEVNSLFAVHEALFPNRPGDLERARKALRSDEYVLTFFQEKRSRIHAKLKAALGSAQSASYLISAFGKRPFTAYGLTLPADAVRFAG